MTIAEYLDALDPAYCLACRTLYKRTDGKWIDGAVRDICSNCGLDQSSAEAGAIRRARFPRFFDGPSSYGEVSSVPEHIKTI